MLPRDPPHAPCERRADPGPGGTGKPRRVARAANLQRLPTQASGHVADPVDACGHSWPSDPSGCGRPTTIGPGSGRVQTRPRRRLPSRPSRRSVAGRTCPPARRLRRSGFAGVAARHAGACGPMDETRPGQRDRTAVGEVQASAGARLERPSHAHQIVRGHLRAGRHRDVKGSSCERLRGSAFRPQPHARVAAHQPTEPLVLRVVARWPLRRLVDPDDEVVERAGQDALDGFEQSVGFGAAGRHGHQILRHREAPTGLCLPEAVVRDELRDLGALLFQAGLLAGARRSARSLVPAHRVTSRHQHAAACEGSVAELGVLAAPLGERLVVAAGQLEERAGHSQIAAGHDPKEVIGVGGELVGSCHVELDPLRPVHGTALEQVRQRPVPAPDSVRVDSGHVDVRSEAERQHIACGMVPACVLCQPACFGHHVAVQEHDDVVRGRADPGVAGACEAEAQVFLMDDTDVERDMGRRRQRLA